MIAGAQRLTIDEAVDTLPPDLAAATLRVMHTSYAAAGDDDNAAWAKTRLREIRARGLAGQDPSFVNAAPRQERAAKKRDAEPAKSPTGAASDSSTTNPSYAQSASRGSLDSRHATHAAQAPKEPTPANIRDGWYPDPRGQHQLRYWSDGSWTDRVADHGVQSDEPLRSTIPQATALVDAGSLKPPPLAARIRSLRKLWVISTLAFLLLAAGFLLLPVKESSIRIDGTGSVSLSCGSVLSPRPSTTHGTALANESSICHAAGNPI